MAVPPYPTADCAAAIAGRRWLAGEGRRRRRRRCRSSRPRLGATGESGGRMIGSVLIEPAIIGDASAIAALDRTVLDGGWEASAVASLIQDPTAICRVARSGSRTAGFALCRLASDECEVLSCAVDAEFRRIGTARLLLQAAFDAAVRGGGRRVFLEVAEDNTPARGSTPVWASISSAGGRVIIGGGAAKRSMP